MPYPAETEIIANVVTSPHHLSATMVDGRVHRMTELFGRLAPGADLDAARAELRARPRRDGQGASRGVPAEGGLPDRRGAAARSDHVAGADGPARAARRVRRSIFVIACSNVANLILARSVRREGELAIRAALGASAGALRRTLLAESLLLCGAGAMLGVADRAADGGGAGAYAARFSVRALDLTVDASLLWVGVGLARRRGGPAGVRAAPALGRRVERARPVERQRADHVGHEPPAAPVRGHADRRVVRAARRRRACC